MLPQYDGSEYVEDLYPTLSLFLADDILDTGSQAIETAVEEVSGGQWAAEDIEALPIAGLLAAIGPHLPTIISTAASLLPMAVQGVQALVNRPAPRARPTAPPPQRPAPRPPARLASPPPTPSAVRPSAPAAPAAPAAGQAASAMQLLTTLTALLPQVVQAVGSLSMGSAGRESILVGERAVPAESVVHMLKTLAEQVLEQYHASGMENAESLDYLRGGDGQFLADPADPLARAEVVFETLLSEAHAEVNAYEQALAESVYFWDPYSL